MILGPYIIEEIYEQMKSIPFIGIATDGSNHKDTKIFPVMFQFFDFNAGGLQHKLVEVDLLRNERAVTIY
jgi:hypothetical protein